MEIVYANRKIEKLLTHQQLMKRHFGPKDTIHLIGLLHQLEYASSLEDIPEAPRPRRHKLTGDLKNHWGIHFSKKNVIVVKPIKNYNIDDLSTITCIEITMVGDYH
jgi:proteic killer suppression protein